MKERDKELNRKYQKEWYVRNKKLQQDRNNRNKYQKKIWLMEYKQSRECEVCGEQHVATLEFHHKNPKEKDAMISWMIAKNRSLDAIKAEIKKCKLVCANCHRKIHYDERFK